MVGLPSTSVAISALWAALRSTRASSSLSVEVPPNPTTPFLIISALMLRVVLDDVLERREALRQRVLFDDTVPQSMIDGLVVQGDGAVRRLHGSDRAEHLGLGPGVLERRAPAPLGRALRGFLSLGGLAVRPLAPRPPPPAPPARCLLLSSLACRLIRCFLRARRRFFVRGLLFRLLAVRLSSARLLLGSLVLRRLLVRRRLVLSCSSAAS